MENYKYDVTLSFAGDDRQYVESVAKCLKSNNIKFFYDKYETVDIWGKNLYTHLDKIYQTESKYCVIFISKSYANSLWTNHERASAQARAFKENEEYILPVRLDETIIPGLLGTIAYIDGKKNSPDQICRLIMNKLKVKINIPTEEPEDTDFEIPKIKRKIDDLEKKKFVKIAFNHVENYFEKGLKLLENQNDHVKTLFEKMTTSKFISEVYVEGEKKNVCKIWISNSMFGNDSICFLQGTNRIDYENDNSINDWAGVSDNGKEIFFKISDMSFGLMSDKINKEKASADDVAKHYWKRFIQYLEY